jgi:hypothetical protein
VVELNFLDVMSSPKSVVGIHPRHKRAGTGSGFPIKPVLERFPDKFFRGQVCRVELGNDMSNNDIINYYTIKFDNNAL